VLTDVGPVEVKVPRDTAGTFEPQIVRKRQRRLASVDELGRISLRSFVGGCPCSLVVCSGHR
jgi:hypothetical protein